MSRGSDRRLGKRLFRLGFSGSFGLDESAAREALERMQYVFWGLGRGSSPHSGRRSREVATPTPSPRARS